MGAVLKNVIVYGYEKMLLLHFNILICNNSK